MASRKQKFYVVWKGAAPGVYASWAECQAATQGYSNARFKAFPTLESAQAAFDTGADEHWGKATFVPSLSEEELAAIGQPITNSLCVDAAWNAQTKVMEYRGVWHHDRSIAFEQGPFPNGTNNIGEFLAIVHALALMAKQSLMWPIYSDSQTAIVWVQHKRVHSKSMRQGETSEVINNLVDRALHWLQQHEYPNEILKWETAAWGEVPADYNRK